jgi:hypothetical protein
VHVTVHALVPVERSFRIRLPRNRFERLDFSRWLEHPRRFDCGRSLACARAGIDVEHALRATGPLPSLPVDPGTIHSAVVEVAVGKRDGVPRRLRLEGEATLARVAGVRVPFEVEVDLVPGARR